MKIITDVLVHTNTSYYDIKSAGPTLIKHLKIEDLTKIQNKERRNIQYGKLIKKYNIERYIPWILTTFSKILCYELDGILYTTDSIVCKRNINESILVKVTCFDFLQKWKAKLLIISKTRKSYFAKLDDNTILIKGDELAPKILNKLLSILDSKNWIYIFKRWFKSLNDVEYFITNKNNIFLYDQVLHVQNLNVNILGISNKINKELYWKKLLPYIQSIYLFF